MANTEENEDDVIMHQNTKQPHRQKRFIRRLAFELFCLAWTSPIILLLSLNFKGWVVGAGVGCRLPGFKNACDISFQSDRAVKLNKIDHEILRGLQIVAKVLEIWFTIIATSLMYDLTIMLAAKRNGLPIGYFMTHAELGNITTVFAYTFWSSMGLVHHRNQEQGRMRLWLVGFVASIIMLCVACNLMGPSIAILALPTLGWSDLQHLAQQKLGQVGAANSPVNPEIAHGCEAASLAAGVFTCTNYYSPSFDASFSTAIFGFQEFLEKGLASPLTGSYQESGLSATYNTTLPSTNSSDTILWVPNRQVVRELSDDYIGYQSSQGDETTFSDASSFFASYTGKSLDRSLFDSYRNSLDISLIRQGPSLGFKHTYCSRANISVMTLSPTQFVRCYNITLSPDLEDQWIDCIRDGSGWGEAQLQHADFSIVDINQESVGNITVNAYTTMDVVTLTEPASSCASTIQTTDSCDWAAMFSNNSSSGVVKQYGSQQFIEYTLPRLSDHNASVVCSYGVQSAVVNYAVDSSVDNNPLGLVNIFSPMATDETDIPLHPDWILAAWAVSRSGTVDGNRAAALYLIEELKKAANTQPIEEWWDDLGLLPFVLLHQMGVLHALSLVDFTTINITKSEASVHDPIHTPLLVVKSRKVWSYGQPSRSFTLGAVVLIFGCLCVFIRAGLGFFMASGRPSTLRFFTAALRYSHKGELDGMHKESEIAQVVIRVNHDEFGKVEFLPGCRSLRPRIGSESVELM